MVDGARGVLNALLADVFVFTDHMSGGEAGASPGYGVMLVAETTSARLLSAECSVARETMVSSTLQSMCSACEFLSWGSAFGLCA